MAIQNLDLRSMLRQFGVVTVMDVDVYEAKRYLKDDPNGAYEEGEWDAATTFGVEKLFSLKTLKIANINAEGPTKTATGGQNADVLLKYGKTFTIEMQDALGKYEVLEHIYGAQSNAGSTNASIVAITDRFPGELTLVGKTFVIDKATGAKQPLCIVIPFYLGDGIFNLTQDAEGDISVFDMNGNILRFSNGSVTDSGVEDEYNKGRYLYGKGSDNQFYFFCTLDALASFKDGKSYEEIWNNGATPVVAQTMKFQINGTEVEFKETKKDLSNLKEVQKDLDMVYYEKNGKIWLQIAEVKLDATKNKLIIKPATGGDNISSISGYEIDQSKTPEEWAASSATFNNDGEAAWTEDAAGLFELTVSA